MPTPNPNTTKAFPPKRFSFTSDPVRLSVNSRTTPSAKSSRFERNLGPDEPDATVIWMKHVAVMSKRGPRRAGRD